MAEDKVKRTAGGAQNDPKDGAGIISGVLMREKLTNGYYAPPELTKGLTTKSKSFGK